MLISLKINMFKSITQRIESYKQRTIASIEFLWESAFKGGIFGLIIATIVWISIFLYVVFYYLYMPSLSHTRPVHLQFTACESEKGVCSFPSAHVQLTKKQQLLMIGQKYKIFLSLEMPESPANVDLGMFMVCARLVDKDGVLVSNSCRSTMLHYRSQFLKFLLTCVNLPFLVFGSREEKQTLVVEMYSDFEEHPRYPITDIYVEVQTRFIELYSATMQIQAHLTGLRYLMFHWPLLSAIFGILSNLFVIAFIFSLSWYHLYMQHEYGRSIFVKCIKKTLTLRPLKHRIWRKKNYFEESTGSTEEMSSRDSGSETVDTKSESFGPHNSEELDFYMDADE